MRIVWIASLGLTVVVPLRAQQPTAAPASAPCPAGTICTPVPLPSSGLGMIVYPAKGQAHDVQLQDEQACYTWSNQQTGIDPTKVKTNPDSAAQAAAAKTKQATTGAAVGGAARGAAGGAVVGAITGDAGKGAEVGAAVGAMSGRRKKKQAEKQAAQAGANANVAQAQQQIDTFKKAMGTCLQGKGYTVS